LKGFGRVSLALFLCAAISALAVDIPKIEHPVNDNANILSSSARSRIEESLRAHREKTGVQVAVLTVDTTGELPIEDFSLKTAEGWGGGSRGKDDGVLFTLAVKDRKMRIEVGYGLEPALTDGACGQIIRNVMTPQFKAGNYDKGVEDGVMAIIAHLEGKGEIPGAPEGAASSGSNIGFNAPDLPWPQRILIGAFVFGIIGLFTVMGIATPGMGWFLYVFLIPFWAMFPIIVIGPGPTVWLLATYIIGFPITKILLGRTEWYRNAAKSLKTKGSARIGGFTFSSSGGSSGFSSGSSFSGGGGSSGGGGASGSW
jgi:uncharacterized protein